MMKPTKAANPSSEAITIAAIIPPFNVVLAACTMPDTEDIMSRIEEDDDDEQVVN